MLYQALSAPPVYANAPARNGSLLRARARSGSHPRSPEYSIHYAQFALAASEYFPEVGGTADVREGSAAIPFENLELQPTNDGQSVKSGVGLDPVHAAEGIVVHRQAVTVVSLTNQEEGEDEKY